MYRKKSSPWQYLGIVIVLGIVAAIGWWFLSPLWINTEVNESLPTAPASVPTESSAPATQEQPIEDVPTQTEDAMQAEPTQEQTVSEPTLLLQGSFYGVAHNGSGTASAYQLADGSHILRLEKFQVENGPDLYVYLVPVDPVPNQSGSEIPGAVSLGKLKGNIGDQNYELPADLDLSQYRSVVIWCQAFSVPFSAAPLAAQ